MHGVVRAEPMTLGEVAGVLPESFGELHSLDCLPESSDPTARHANLRRREPADAPSAPERRPRLGVEEW